MVNNEGMFLLNNSNNIIRIEGNNVVIAESGEVFVDGGIAAVIGIADFNQSDYEALQGIGKGLFVKPAAVNETPRNLTTQLLQGYLEDSNVDQVNTMVDMIELFRAFELGQKAIQIQDQTLQRVVTEVGVVR